MPSATEQVKIRIDKNFEMPSIPLVVSRILQLLSDDTVSARALEDVIMHDPSLSLRILRIANSAFYSFSHEVKIISHAIALLGLNFVKSLAIGVSIFEVFTRGLASERLLINRLWMHSFGSGLLSQAIWARRGLSREGEFAVLCGLLHDIGKAVIFKNDPREYGKLMSRQVKEEGFDLCTEEMTRYGTDHASLGAMLLMQWSLPPDLAHVVQRHHHALDADSRLVSAVALADRIARETGIGYKDMQARTEDIGLLQEQLSMNIEEYNRLKQLADERRAEVEGYFSSYWCRI